MTTHGADESHRPRGSRVFIPNGGLCIGSGCKGCYAGTFPDLFHGDTGGNEMLPAIGACAEEHEFDETDMIGFRHGEPHEVGNLSVVDFLEYQDVQFDRLETEGPAGLDPRPDPANTPSADFTESAGIECVETDVDPTAPRLVEGWTKASRTVPLVVRLISSSPGILASFSIRLITPRRTTGSPL